MSRFAQPDHSLFKTFSGDLTIVLRLLNRFKEEWDKTIIQWNQCLNEADAQGIFQIQHRWLSGLRTLGYETMAQRISALQIELQENPSDLTKIHALKEGLEEIQADLTTEITALQGLMQHPKK
jgi:HPt (histidine-containing phosphotransfer) domain-containing protein